MSIGFVVHLAREGALDAVRRARSIVEAQGEDVRIAVPDPVDHAPLPEDLVDAMVDLAALATSTMLVSFGGDGTFLRAARIARDGGIPIVGVNVGRLGFLTEIDPEELERLLPSLLEAAPSVQPRMTLEAEVRDAAGQEIGRLWALNDVSVEKLSRQRLVRLEVEIGATPFASVAADGVIVASSTGSTAYALSAGGPIVSPAIDAMLVVPVAPHSLFDRTVIAHPAQSVVIRVAADQDGALVTGDGMEPILVPPGGSVEVRGNGRPVLMATVAGVDFFGRVRRKFRLG